MHRLGHLIGGEWRRYSGAAQFHISHRLTASVPGSDPGVIEQMIGCLNPPYSLLYVLHTPRGEADAGRYQSPELSFAEVRQFLGKFRSFLSSDGRFDLWAHSPVEAATIVWDRHDLLFAYGPVDRYATKLVEMGFSEGEPRIPAPHEHCYHSEVDDLARELIAYFDWSYSPLHASDEQ